MGNAPSSEIKRRNSYPMMASKKGNMSMKQGAAATKLPMPEKGELDERFTNILSSCRRPGNILMSLLPETGTGGNNCLTIRSLGYQRMSFKFGHFQYDPDWTIHSTCVSYWTIDITRPGY